MASALSEAMTFFPPLLDLVGFDLAEFENTLSFNGVMTDTLIRHLHIYCVAT